MELELHGTLKIYAYLMVPYESPDSDECTKCVEKTLHTAYFLTLEEAKEHARLFNRYNQIENTRPVWYPRKVELGRPE